MPTYKSGTSMVLGVEETLIDGASEDNNDIGDTDCTSILGSVVPAVITLVGTKLFILTLDGTLLTLFSSPSILGMLVGNVLDAVLILKLGCTLEILVDSALGVTLGNELGDMLGVVLGLTVRI